MSIINISGGSKDSTPSEDAITRPTGRRPRSDADLSIGISLAPKGFDGMWRAHSRDLTDELPRLIAAMNQQGIPVFRVSYHLASWNPAPHRLTIGGRVIRLGGYRTMHPDQLSTVDIAGGHRTSLRVVPAGTEARTAGDSRRRS